jgi:hypothetical protein
MAYRRGDNDRPEVLGHGFIEVITWGQNMSREAMQLALEALESDPISHTGLVNRKQAITALRQALKTEQKPVAWANTLDFDDDDIEIIPAKAKGKLGTSNCDIPLYAAPQKKEWVGLTDEEVSYCRYAATFCDELDTAYMAELIEKDLKEKNT